MTHETANPVRDLQDRVAAALPGSGAPEGGSPVGSAAANDPLVMAIADIAAHFGLPASPVAMAAGLPLLNGRLPLEHAAEAASRAGLILDIVEADPTRLDASRLPLIVLTRDGDPEVLWRFETDHPASPKPSAAVMSAPGTSPRDRVAVPIADLRQSSAGRVIALRPATGLDERGREAVAAEARGWFLRAFADSRRIYAEAIAATLAVNVLALAVPLFSMNVYDRVLPNAAETTLWALALGVGLAIVFDFLIRTLRAAAVDAASRRADARLSAFIYGRLMGARVSATPPSTGVRANTLREFETLREFFNSATLTAFGDLPFLALFLIVLFVVAGPLVWVVAAAIPVLLAIGYCTQRALLRLIDEAFREAAQKNAVATETLAGLETIKAAGAESWAALKWERATADHIRTGIAMRHVSNLGQHTIHAVQTLVQILVVVFGFYLVSAGDLTMGGLIAATILAGRALQPLGQAAGLIARYNGARIAHRALTEIIAAPQERTEGATYLAKADIAGRLAFEAVTYSYAPMAEPALKAVSFDIGAGERVAILGAIGSGKTTVLRLLQGLAEPTSGRVLVDGVSVGQIEPALLRRQVALLLQDAALFHGTIRENITMAAPHAIQADLVAAAKISGALAWIARLPLGFDTPLRERGIGLSGGQRQSVALARALVSNPRVLLLDEPTSEMDARTEQSVIAALAEWSKERTLVIVTHRPALLDLVDRLVVMDAGRIVHDGPKAEVLAKLTPVSGHRPEAGAATAPPRRARTKVTVSPPKPPALKGGGS